MFIVPLDTERKWYRYHHLFANLLKQRLWIEKKNDIKALHNKASLWFEENKMFTLAVEHTIKEKNYNKAIQLLSCVVETMWEKGQHSAIVRYGDMLPEKNIKKNPGFCLFYAWVLITSGKISEAEPFLESAENIVKKIISDENSLKESVENNKKLLGKISVALAYMNSLEIQSEKILDYSKTAMENLSDDDPLWFSWAWYSIGMAEMSWSKFTESNKSFNKALEFSKKSENFYLISTIAISLAYLEQELGHYTSSFNICSELIEFMKESGYSQIVKEDWTYSGLYTMMSVTQCIWTDFDGALESVEIAYRLCKNEKNISQKTIALLAYSYILYARENKTGAVNKLKELEDIMRQNKISPFILPTYVGWKIHMLISEGELDKANDFVKENVLKPYEKKSFQNEFAYISYAYLLLVQYKIDEAASLLSELYTLAYTGKRIDTIVQLKILYAIMYKITNKQEKAVANLIEAMEFAVEENLLIHFVNDIEFTKDLLNEAFKIQMTKKTKITKEFIDNLKLAIKKKEKFMKIIDEADLSARELDTLKLIAEEFTNKEIADKLFISLNTVKTHLKSINIKLDVNNRNKAVIKAKKLGLLLY